MTESEVGGHASTDATAYDLPPLPAALVQPGVVDGDSGSLTVRLRRALVQAEAHERGLREIDQIFRHDLGSAVMDAVSGVSELVRRIRYDLDAIAASAAADAELDAQIGVSTVGIGTVRNGEAQP